MDRLDQVASPAVWTLLVHGSRALPRLHRVEGGGALVPARRIANGHVGRRGIGMEVDRHPGRVDARLGDDLPVVAERLVDLSLRETQGALDIACEPLPGVAWRRKDPPPGDCV